MSNEVHIDIMESGTIIMHAEDGRTIAGIKIHSPDDARTIAKALMAAADLVDEVEQEEDE